MYHHDALHRFRDHESLNRGKLGHATGSLTISDDDSGFALEEYVWVPPGLTPKQVNFRVVNTYQSAFKNVFSTKTNQSGSVCLSRNKLLISGSTAVYRRTCATLEQLYRPGFPSSDQAFFASHSNHSLKYLSRLSLT